MGRTILCVGDYAEIPYYVETIGLHIYSIEELCYYLTENAFLLDREIINRDLVNWIEEQCGLEELAKTLYGLINASATVSEYVGTILEYVGYVSADEMTRIQGYLKNNGNMSSLEKEKAHADYLLENKRYTQAHAEYHKLLENEIEDQMFYAAICHNQGICYVGMMLFEAAANSFYEAYEKNGSESSLEAYLCALRMLHSEKEYVAFLSDKPEYTQAALAVEEKFAGTKQSFMQTEDGKRIEEIMQLREAGNVDIYEKKINQEIYKMKENYRNSR